MQTFTQALIELVVAGEVDREVAANASTNRHDFLVALDQALKRQGRRRRDRPPRLRDGARAARSRAKQPMPGLRIAGSQDG